MGGRARSKSGRGVPRAFPEHPPGPAFAKDNGRRVLVSAPGPTRSVTFRHWRISPQPPRLVPGSSAAPAKTLVEFEGLYAHRRTRGVRVEARSDGAAGGCRPDPSLGEHVRITPDSAAWRADTIAVRAKDERSERSDFSLPARRISVVPSSRSGATKVELRGCASRDRAPRGPYRPTSGVFRLSPTGKNAYDPPAKDV
jgi:hypothetical protein